MVSCVCVCVCVCMLVGCEGMYRVCMVAGWLAENVVVE